VTQKNSGLTGDMNIGLVVLSPEYQVIGVNKYASEILRLGPQDIGKSVYKYHPSKIHSRLKNLLNRAQRAKAGISAPVIMNVLNRVLAVSISRMELKDTSFKSIVTMSFIDVTRQAEGGKKHVDRRVRIRKIPVYERGSYLFLDPDFIYLIKCEGNYCRAYTEWEQYCLRVAMNEIERKYMGQRLVRVHRCFIVNLDNIHRIIKDAKGQNHIDFNKGHIPLAPVARRRVEGLKKVLSLID